MTIMGFILFILFLMLVCSLVLTLMKKGKFAGYAKIFRISTVVLGIGIFAYWFTESSVSRFLKDSLSTQVINKLPQPIDFYIIRIDNAEDHSFLYEVKHLGKIRPEYFRIEYMQMQNSGEFWLTGYLGKGDPVYFSQHSVPNKNIDQIIEVKNYIIQSEKLAETAQSLIDAETQKEISQAIWISLNQILLFLNLILLLRKK